MDEMTQKQSCHLATGTCELSLENVLVKLHHDLQVLKFLFPNRHEADLKTPAKGIWRSSLVQTAERAGQALLPAVFEQAELEPGASEEIDLLEQALIKIIQNRRPDKRDDYLPLIEWGIHVAKNYPYTDGYFWDRLSYILYTNQMTNRQNYASWGGGEELHFSNEFERIKYCDRETLSYFMVTHNGARRSDEKKILHEMYMDFKPSQLYADPRYFKGLNSVKKKVRDAYWHDFKLAFQKTNESQSAEPLRLYFDKILPDIMQQRNDFFDAHPELKEYNVYFDSSPAETCHIHLPWKNIAGDLQRLPDDIKRQIPAIITGVEILEKMFDPKNCYAFFGGRQLDTHQRYIRYVDLKKGETSIFVNGDYKRSWIVPNHQLPQIKRIVSLDSWQIVFVKAPQLPGHSDESVFQKMATPDPADAQAPKSLIAESIQVKAPKSLISGPVAAQASKSLISDPVPAQAPKSLISDPVAAQASKSLISGSSLVQVSKSLIADSTQVPASDSLISGPADAQAPKSLIAEIAESTQVQAPKSLISGPTRPKSETPVSLSENRSQPSMTSTPLPAEFSQGTDASGEPHDSPQKIGFHQTHPAVFHSPGRFIE